MKMSIHVLYQQLSHFVAKLLFYIRAKTKAIRSLNERRYLLCLQIKMQSNAMKTNCYLTLKNHNSMKIFTRDKRETLISFYCFIH